MILLCVDSVLNVDFYWYFISTHFFSKEFEQQDLLTLLRQLKNTDRVKQALKNKGSQKSGALLWERELDRDKYLHCEFISIMQNTQKKCGSTSIEQLLATLKDDLSQHTKKSDYLYQQIHKEIYEEERVKKLTKQFLPTRESCGSSDEQYLA